MRVGNFGLKQVRVDERGSLLDSMILMLWDEVHSLEVQVTVVRGSFHTTGTRVHAGRVRVTAGFPLFQPCRFLEFEYVLLLRGLETGRTRLVVHPSLHVDGVASGGTRVLGTGAVGPLNFCAGFQHIRIAVVRDDFLIRNVIVDLGFLHNDEVEGSSRFSVRYFLGVPINAFDSWKLAVSFANKSFEEDNGSFFEGEILALEGFGHATLSSAGES